MAGNLSVKEVVIDDGVMRDRFVICRNPDQAERDRIVRERLVTQLEEAIAGSDDLAATDRAAQLPAGLRRFLLTTKAGLLRVDRTTTRAEAHLDGKFLLRTSDPTLSAEDVALGWRDMNTTLDLRPVYHHLQDRIRAHVLLCWLALLLIRVAETELGDTWRNIRRELQRLHLGTFAEPAGRVLQRTEITNAQAGILRALNVDQPPKSFDVDPHTSPG